MQSCWWPQPAAAPTLAAIGIFSHSPNSPLRLATRRGFLSPASAEEARAAGIGAYFVLRGGEEWEIEESIRHPGTMVFVRGDATRHGRASGPLVSLRLWWQCTRETWPSADRSPAFVGKADDDVYLHLPGVAAHLTAAVRAVRTAHPETSSSSPRLAPRIVWGAFEAFYFEPTLHRPERFCQDGPGMRCGVPSPRAIPSAAAALSARLANGSLVGPFPFARGPLFCLSRELVDELLSSSWCVLPTLPGPYSTFHHPPSLPFLPPRPITYPSHFITSAHHLHPSHLPPPAPTSHHTLPLPSLTITNHHLPPPSTFPPPGSDRTTSRPFAPLSPQRRSHERWGREHAAPIRHRCRRLRTSTPAMRSLASSRAGAPP